jgi:ubiquitin carboxyl-terminal hydrolase 10
VAQFLRNYQPNHVAAAILPRGLANRSNLCFINAILQALLACPPFYNLMKSLAALNDDLSSPPGRHHSATPMMEAMMEFVSEFAPLEAMNKSQKKDRGRKREDLPVGVPLEPACVYRALLQLKADTFKMEEGRHEDAEEFLTCLLNMLSEEMQSLMKLADDPMARRGRDGEVCNAAAEFSK